MARSEVPYFIEIRGCINCRVSGRVKEKTGQDYCFVPEAMFDCLVRDCFDWRVSNHHPYLDPVAVVGQAKAMAGEPNWPEIKERARAYCLALEGTFGDFYRQMGISVDEIIKELEADL